MPIRDMDDFNNNDKINAFVKNADMKNDVTKNKGGRPKKSDEEKANKQIFVNLTKDQKDKLESYSKDLGISVSAVVKMALNKEGIL